MSVLRGRCMVKISVRLPGSAVVILALLEEMTGDKDLVH